MMPNNAEGGAPPAGPQSTTRPASSTMPEADVLAELRRDLAAVVADLKREVEARGADAGAIAQQGVGATREIIVRHPVVAIGTALLLGAGLGLLVMPPRPVRSRSARAYDWAASAVPAGFSNAIAQLPPAYTRVPDLSMLGSTLERVIEAVSSVDPGASIPPALQKAGEWLRSARAAIGKS